MKVGNVNVNVDGMRTMEHRKEESPFNKGKRKTATERNWGRVEKIH